MHSLQNIQTHPQPMPNLLKVRERLPLIKVLLNFLLYTPSWFVDHLYSQNASIAYDPKHSSYICIRDIPNLNQFSHIYQCFFLYCIFITLLPSVTLNVFTRTTPEISVLKTVILGQCSYTQYVQLFTKFDQTLLHFQSTSAPYNFYCNAIYLIFRSFIKAWSSGSRRTRILAHVYFRKFTGHRAPPIYTHLWMEFDFHTNYT